MFEVQVGASRPMLTDAQFSFYTRALIYSTVRLPMSMSDFPWLGFMAQSVHKSLNAMFCAYGTQS